MKYCNNNSKSTYRNRKWLYIEISTIEYPKALDLQHKLVIARREEIIVNDVILFLEHPPVFTLGRRGGLNNLTVSEDFLEKAGIPVIQVERGGNITFHGPGQIVVYPIIDMRTARLGVADYVNSLEEVMIRTAADQGIMAERNAVNRGVWVGMSKIGSLGIAVRNSVSFHGFALNVNTSMEPFRWIHPCGLKGIHVTSMKRVLGKDISMEEVRHAIALHIQEIFGVELVKVGLEDIYPLL